MSRRQVIDQFQSRLREALDNDDWEWADRAVERLKALLMEAVVDDDAESIARIQAVLVHEGEGLELGRRLSMEDGPDAAAWRMRADAGTATIAVRLRQASRRREGDDEPRRAQLLKLLREANRSLTNTDITIRLGWHPSVTTRLLKQLEADGLVRSWKAGAFRHNRITERGRQARVARIDALHENRAQAAGNIRRGDVSGKHDALSGIGNGRLGTLLAPLGPREPKQQLGPRNRAAELNLSLPPKPAGGMTIPEEAPR